ncbi:MAG: hypothetical protein WC878_00110 [Candidatus Paceibacterota bacterium]|jgi:hypothetical protein
MKTKKEPKKNLPLIVLKYHCRPSEVKDENRPPSGVACYFCRAKNIVDISGGFRDKKGKEQVYCEKCATKMYKEELGFRTYKAAYAHRRRLFDVGYLFNEIITDEYMKMRGFTKVDDVFEKFGALNEISKNLWNYLFSKEEKNELKRLKNKRR